MRKAKKLLGKGHFVQKPIYPCMLGGNIHISPLFQSNLGDIYNCPMSSEAQIENLDIQLPDKKWDAQLVSITGTPSSKKTQRQSNQGTIFEEANWKLRFRVHERVHPTKKENTDPTKFKSLL